MSRQCPQANAAPRGEIVKAAERMSRDMIAKISGQDPNAALAIDVRSFRAIATLLGLVAADSSRCGGDDCMGRAVDGIRLWVTKDRLEQSECEVRRLTEALTLAELEAGDLFPNWSLSEEAAPKPPASFS